MNPRENLDAQIEAWLGQLGLDAAPRPGGTWVVGSDSSVLLVSTFTSPAGGGAEQDDDPAFCRISALVLTDFAPSLPLLHRILLLNNDVLIGGFRLFEDRTLAFSTTLHGGSLDADTFAHSLRYVAQTADTWGPVLRELAGGRLGADHLQGRAS